MQFQLRIFKRVQSHKLLTFSESGRIRIGNRGTVAYARSDHKPLPLLPGKFSFGLKLMW